LSNGEFGIERYVDLAQEQTKAPGPSGPPGASSPGPGVLGVDLTTVIANVGQEISVAEYTFSPNEIGENDIFKIEWWGDAPVDDAVGFDSVTVRLYWDGTLLDTVTPQRRNGVFIASAMELLTGSLNLSIEGSGFPTHVAQFSDTAIPGWRQSGGTLQLTVESSVGQTIGIATRFILVTE
jgi:hypothetical protein